MPVRVKHHELNEIYFITFTCFQWKPLIELSNAYASFYKWFNYLIERHIDIIGYVIMPNHFHGLFMIPDLDGYSLNKCISNGKRFIAYDIIKGLKDNNRYGLLHDLHKGLQPESARKKQRHRVFRPSFDVKQIYNDEMLEVKLNYIHLNPVSKRWNLVDDFREYEHSSAGYYLMQNENKYVTDFNSYIFQ